MGGVVLLKILTVSDLFIKNDNFKKTLEKKLGNIDRLTIKNLTYDWPLTPLQEGDEVTEFVGSVEELKNEINDVDLLIVDVAPVTEDIIKTGSKLKAIGVTRGGPINVNINAATKYGIPVFNAPGRNAPAVAEFTVAVILGELKNIPRAHADLIKGKWRGDFYIYDKTGFELPGKIAGLIGFGNISCQVSKLLQAFGMNIIAYDPYVNKKKMEYYGVKKVGLNKLLNQSDVVSLHVRLNKGTEKMINSKVFKKMKSSALFVNTARGGIVDYDDLVKALKEGEIAAAALDVFENEPLEDNNPLLELNNVTITPHIGGASKETAYRSTKMVVEEIANYLKNDDIINCLNSEVLS